MPKKVIKMVKLQVPAGKATPAPPVGPALGQAGINIMAFVKDFNARTEKQAGLIILLKYGIRRPFLYLHHEDSSRCCPSEKGRWYR